MKYSRFGALAFVLGSAAIVGSLFVPSTSQVIPAEVAAQLLLILILAGALLWGRNGGFITALIATAVYVGMRYSLLTAEGLSADVVTMIVARVVGYAVVGIVGGELAGRTKYLLARTEHDSMIDPATRVYSAQYAGRAIATAIGKHHRYGTACSVVVLTVAPTVWADLRAARLNALMRRVASYLRNDVRLVDDVAYRGNGGFIVIFPETPSEGADVAGRRLRTGIAGLLGCESSAIAVRTLTCGTDDEMLDELSRALAPEGAVDPESAPSTSSMTGGRASERAGESA